MQDKLTVADDAAQVADVLAHGFMTLIADGCQRLQVTVDPPTGKVAWVMHVKAYPINLSIHLDRAGLELLADRISQAIQDYGTPCPRCQGSGTVTIGAPCRGGLLSPCPVCEGGGLLLPPSGDGVDLDDPALTNGAE